MNHRDHVGLLREAVSGPGTWAEFGSGRGAFTLALADLLAGAGAIYSVDRDRGALREQARQIEARFPGARVEYIAADYTRPLDLPPLDGLLMANSLHFQKDKQAVLRRACEYLRPDGKFVLVEYNTDRGNTWVPYPLSYRTFEELARRCGFAGVRQTGAVPSSFLGEIYSALAVVPRS